MTKELHPWTQAVHLQADVEAGQTAVAIYAIDLGALVAGDESVPLIYRRARDFFATTHLTSGLHRLLEDMLGGLAGKSGDRVLQLRSPFGGGKSHTLAALYHAGNERAALDALPEAKGLPNPGKVRVAVFDGEKFDTKQGKDINGLHAKTLWGYLAAQLGCYELVADHDRDLIAPGGDVVARMLGKGTKKPEPIMILLDEVLKYMERVMALPVGESTLGRQTLDFLQTLSVEVAGTSNAVMVYSLQASTREAYGDEELLTMLDHLTSRVDAKREPVSGDEILPVLRRRLLAETPKAEAARNVAEAFSDEITHVRAAHAADDSSRRDAEDDRLTLLDRFVAAYPFHPALIDIMRERWASLPDYGRTRGALRFLAICLHTLKRDNAAGLLLGPGDVPIGDKDVQQAFFTEVGQREPFKAVLERDFFGQNARVSRIDDRLARENPRLSGVCPAMRMATAILMYSFGGPSRVGEEGGEPVAPGVSESELLSTVVTPEIDSITAQAVLKDLREQCLYLHFDGVRYVFKTTPNITQVLEQEAEHVSKEEIEQAIHDELENRLRGRLAAILWPHESQFIPDREPRFLLAYLPLDVASENEAKQKSLADEMFTKYGDKPRRHRNGLGLAIPERNQVNPLRRAVRYLKAIDRVRSKRQSYNLSTSQMDQLKDREKTDLAAQEAAIRSLYQSVWLPLKMDGKRVEIEKVSLSGRPLQSQNIHERLFELLSISPPRLFPSVTPEKILELLKIGSSKGSPLGVTTGKIVESFYEILGYPRLESDNVIRQAVANGVRSGVFGYTGRASQVDLNQLREGGTYLVDASHVRLGSLPDDEIDMSAGVIVLPQAIRPETPSEVEIVTPGDDVSQETERTAIPEASQETHGYTAKRTHLRLSMQMTRQQLFAAWNAFKNLADLVGNIRLTIEVDKADGFDQSWLQNALYEPLDEADVDVQEE
jgi:hypothetical protein